MNLQPKATVMAKRNQPNLDIKKPRDTETGDVRLNIEMKDPQPQTDKVDRAVRQEGSAIPQLPTRLDLYTAAALTGILAHHTSSPPVVPCDSYYLEALAIARRIGQLAVSYDQGSPKPEDPQA